MERMIDFTLLQGIIPEDGSLVLKFTRNNGKVSVCYAPRYKGKEDAKELSPVILTGTAEELNAEFAGFVRDVYPLQNMYATQGEKAKKKKEELEKALKGKDKAGQKPDGDGGGLFEKKKKAEQKKEPSAPAPEEKAEEGKDCGECEDKTGCETCGKGGE